MDARKVEKNSWHMKLARSVRGANKHKYQPKNSCYHFWMVSGAAVLWLMLATLVMGIVSFAGFGVFLLIANPISFAYIAIVLGILVGLVVALVVIGICLTAMADILKLLFRPIGKGFGKGLLTIGKGIQFVFNPVLKGIVTVLLPVAKGLRFVGYNLIGRPLIGVVCSIDA